MVKIASLSDALSEILELDTSPVEGLSLQQKIWKGEKGKAKKNTKKLLSCRLLSCLSKNVVKVDVVERKERTIFDNIF